MSGLYSRFFLLFTLKTLFVKSLNGFHLALLASFIMFLAHSKVRIDEDLNTVQGRALAELGDRWHPTFAPGRVENLRFFIQIICWAPWILQVQSTGRPSIFLRAQPCSLHPPLDYLRKS